MYKKELITKTHSLNYYSDGLPADYFHSCKTPAHLPGSGNCWELDACVGRGYYWMFCSEKGYKIKIHNFAFKEDMVLNMSYPESLSVTWYDSIAGDEFNPYRPLRTKVVKSFLGGDDSFRALIHKDIPVNSIGIEYETAYYEPFLSSLNNEEYLNPRDAFCSIDETSDFSEMEMLLKQTQAYTGTGLTAELFYDAKASEALSLVFERQKRLARGPKPEISSADADLLRSVADYIRDHCADELPLELLSQIACMGTTKLKKTFKAMFGSTISDYIAMTRISQAQRLLNKTDLSIGQVAQAVGYSNAGRFASLFRASTGILPSAYRKKQISQHILVTFFRYFSE